MRDYAIQTWGTWLDKESKQAAIEDTAKGKIQIICIGEEQAGTFEIEEVGSELVINQLYLLQKFQNNGVGTEILRDLKEKARKMSVPIMLSVLLVNPAQRFYKRNGFTVQSETAERVYMRYTP
jgi:GNAT superfamily N-acetyltransferase